MYIHFLDLIFRYIDDTPFVRGTMVTFSLDFGRTVTGASCAIEDGSENIRDCELRKNKLGAYVHEERGTPT